MFYALPKDQQKHIEESIRKTLLSFHVNSRKEDPVWLYATRDWVVKFLDQFDIFHGAQETFKLMDDFEQFGCRGLFNEMFQVWHLINTQPPFSNERYTAPHDLEEVYKFCMDSEPFAFRK